MPSNIQPPSPIACSISVPANALVASSAVASVSEYCSRNVSGSGSVDVDERRELLHAGDAAGR